MEDRVAHADKRRRSSSTPYEKCAAHGAPVADSKLLKDMRATVLTSIVAFTHGNLHYDFISGKKNKTKPTSGATTEKKPASGTNNTSDVIDLTIDDSD